VFRIKLDFAAGLAGVGREYGPDETAFDFCPNEVIARLDAGFSRDLPTMLGAKLDVDSDELRRAFSEAKEELSLNFAAQNLTAMQACELVEGIVSTAILLAPATGEQSVGGKVQSAIVTKDGFGWSKRPQKLKPPPSKQRKRKRGKR
jgi:hypothetical protein